MPSLGLRAAIVLVALAIALPIAASPPDRYELGKRVRAFERAWGTCDDPSARARALPLLERATAAFFTFRLGTAAEAIDDARHALASPLAPPAAVRWASRWAVVPSRRWVEAGLTRVDVALVAVYGSGEGHPAGAWLELRLTDVRGAPIGAPARWPIPAQATTVALRCPPIPAGDHTLWFEVGVDGTTGPLASGTVGVSASADRPARLARLERAAAGWAGAAQTTARASVVGLDRLLRGLATGDALEADLPADRLLADALAAVDAGEAGEAGAPAPAPEPGQHWWWLATPGGTVPVRVQAPATGAPAPLVIALHGAGGSENLWFEAYGNGQLARHCERRGWILAAPRQGMFGTPALGALVRSIGALHPIDPDRVFLVGHSMGAGQALAALAQGDRDLFAAAALIGGGRAPRDVTWLRTLPLYLAAGEHDFGRSGVEAIFRAATDAGHPRVRLRIVPGAEHLSAVTDAVPDAMAFLDEVAGNR